MFYLLKLITTPVLIAIASLAAKRWGPVIGGAIAGMPFISGPGSIFICAQQGPEFAALAAYSSLLGLGASCAYCLAYAHCARYANWPTALLTAVAAFAVSALGLMALPYSMPMAFFFAVVGPLVCLRLLPVIAAAAPRHKAEPWWRLPAQMVCGGLTVFLLTEFSRMLGEQWSGVLLTFPIMTSILTPFAHLSYGALAAVQTIRGLLIGFMGTSTFLLIVANGLERMGPALGFSTAVLGAFLASMGAMLWSRRTVYQ